MNLACRVFQLCLAGWCISFATIAAPAQPPQESFEPYEGQEGKDVVWVPTPPELVEKMLDLARLTPQDYVIDLGSGDGRNVIAAAKRGARALGVEYNPDMVELSKRTAEKEGVADKATFVQGDMYLADISQASVLALFLLAENLHRLTPKFLALKPGTRIVVNTYGIEGWTADATYAEGSGCWIWCNALLYIVPARVAGTWRLPQGLLTFTQEFQMVSGKLTANGATTTVENGRLRGDEISFTAGKSVYTGRVNGDAIEGVVKGDAAGTWTAVRARR